LSAGWSTNKWLFQAQIFVPPWCQAAHPVNAQRRNPISSLWEFNFFISNGRGFAGYDRILNSIKQWFAEVR